MAASDATLGFSTPLLCQQLWSGDYQVFPVAAPALTSHGSTLEACLSEQRLFLEEHLAQLDPEQLSRFSFPARTRLEMLEVRASRADLPKRHTPSTLIELAAVVVPLAAETWVFVPALEHTVYVDAEQDVRETVRTDGSRPTSNRRATIHVGGTVR